MFKIKSQTCQRCSEGTKKPLCVPQVREGSSDPYKRLSQTCLWVFEVLLWRHRSAVTCRQGRGSGCCRPGRFSMGHESLWRRPLLPRIIEPLSRQPTNWRTRIPKKFSHCYKNSRAHNRFPNLGIQQKDWETPPPQGNRLFKGTTKPYVHQDPRERSSDSTRDRAKLTLEDLGVSGGGVGQQWPATGSGTLTTAVLGTVVWWHKSFWRRSPWPLVPLPQFGLSPNYREGTQPHPSAEN